jgi:hypothetical protein
VSDYGISLRWQLMLASGLFAASIISCSTLPCVAMRLNGHIMRRGRNVDVQGRLKFRHLASLHIASADAAPDLRPRKSSNAKELAHVVLECICNIEESWPRRPCKLCVPDLLCACCRYLTRYRTAITTVPQ